MSPKRLNPESRVTSELLGDVSGLQQEFARVAYGKDRDGHGYRLPLRLVIRLRCFMRDLKWVRITYAIR